jgi:hypothetical protein
MALHRDIYWVGRQWTVTGYGIQACDQKQKGQFDIEASRIWEEDVLDRLRALKWLHAEDFEKAVTVARKHYPEPSRSNPPAEDAVPAAGGDVSTGEHGKPASENCWMRIGSVPARARLVRVWRVRTRMSIV